MLEVSGIAVHYGEAQAVHDLSLHVSQGELVTLVGANGAGKTTTLRAVSGLRPVSAGTIAFDGADITKLAAARRAELGMALVPEGRDLWPRLTVRENLILGAYGKRARKHLAESLDRVYTLFPRVGERPQQMAGSMSGGEQQMVAIGRALMSRPRLLMLDEPSLGLAPVIVSTVFATIKQLHADGLTILLVEQNVSKALRIADRGYVLETGSVVLEGGAADLSANPAVRAAYLGV